MRQLVQSVRSGELTIVEAPDPLIGPTEVLVQTTHSVVSAGTERAVRELASAGLLQKAKARPDLVRQVLRKAREDGLRTTASAVRTKLDGDMPLGYSGAGVVLEVGEAVPGIRPGMGVATGGAGHGDLQVVAGLLAVPIPDGAENEHAAFATVASIALHGLRVADVGPGGSICVVGLGLIGQLTVRLALAAGLRVFGVDLREWTVDKAVSAGAAGAVERGEETTRQIVDWSKGRGVDAVLLTAATPSSQPALLAPGRLRDRGTIVVVGDVGMDLKRTPLYEKEISIKVARSYGPGRYERPYEEWAVDYPIGHVRFTEGRNMEVVLDYIASGRVEVGDLITHRFPLERAVDAYAVLAAPDAEYLGIELTYAADREKPTTRPVRRVDGSLSVALIGAGAFAKGVLLPSMRNSEFGTICSISSASGVTAARLAGQLGVQAVSVQQALSDESIDVVVIATSHDSHAELVARALRAGKHVFSEKPLAIDFESLDDVVSALQESGRDLAVGFNRRFSPDIRQAISTLGESGGGPLVLMYRVNAGSLPDEHWYHDRRQGGRLIGEVCHFIDTCCAVVDRPVVDIRAYGGAAGEALLAEDITVVMAFDDGSTASIAYSSGGHRGGSKERLEIMGRGHSIVIDDYRTMTIDGERTKHAQDKGHTAQFDHWIDVLKGVIPTSGESMVESMRLTLTAADSLRRHPGAAET